MSIDPGAFWSALLGAMGTWVAGIIATWFAGFGKALHGASSRSALITAILSLGISVGAVIAIFMFPQSISPQQPVPPKNIIAGHYNGGGLDSLTSNFDLKTTTNGPFVRILFNDLNLKTVPVVILTPKYGHLSSIENLTNEYVEVRSQTIDSGKANGTVSTNLQFWFQIIPPL